MNFQRLDKNVQGYEGVVLPPMVRIRQKFDSRSVGDVSMEMQKQLSESLDRSFIEGLRGKRLAISAGSRGIPRYRDLLRSLCLQLKEWGALPFVFPAMGSHAGGTAESQKQFLADYGIVEEYIGAPVISSMDVMEIARLEDGMPVYCDRNAFQADGIVLFHKVKPHTHFKADHESGLLKMLCIGMGKHKGASAFHRKGFDNFGKYLVDVSRAFLQNANVVFAVGLIQNAYDQIGKIEVIPPEKILEKDAELLAFAKEQTARFKFDEIDVLIIDEIGKDISGTGFDPNITGRTEVESQKKAFRDMAPHIKKIVLLDISEHSRGNASGMGEADLVSFRFVNKIDFATTYTNIITNNYLKAAALPIYCNSDLDAVKLAILTGIGTDLENPRIVRVKNTLMLEEFEVSAAFLEEFRDRDDMEVLGEPYFWQFNAQGDLW